MEKIKNEFVSKLEKAKSVNDYNTAWNNLISDLKRDGISYEDVDLDKFVESVFNFWQYTEIPEIETKDDKENKDGTKTTTIKEKPLFKRPTISIRENNRLIETIKIIKKKQEAKEIEKQMVDKLNNQPKASRTFVGKHIKSLVFNSNVNNTYSNITKILNFICQIKNFDLNTKNKCLFYMSNEADGTMKGGNGKSWIINALREAANRLNISNCSRTIPTWHDSEIVSDFSKNVLSFASEQSFCLNHESYDIMDKGMYSTREKYEKTSSLKSICNIIGTTNESLSKADQTLRRRLDIIYCNENMCIDELPSEQKKMIPTQEEQINAWTYLLTHDVSDCFPINKDSEVSITNRERDILWLLVDWKDYAQSLGNGTIRVGTWKELCERENKKITYTEAINVAKKYGAIITKKGPHGREAENGAMIDLSKFEVSESVFEETKPFTLPEVFELIDKEYGTNNPDGDGIDWTLLDKEINEQNNELEKIFSEVENQPKEKIETFDTIEEGQTYSTEKDIFPTNKETDQFQVVNPVSNTRSDANTTSRRNFVFECDDTSLQEQKQIIDDYKDVINRVVFSGNKSLHCRITINYEPEDKNEYKFIFNYLNNRYFGNKADKACSNPARLTRNPNGIRSNNGKKQILIYKTNTVVDVLFLHEEYKKQQEKKQLEMLYMKENNNNIAPKREETIYETLEKHPSDSEGYIATKNALDGNATYDEVPKIISYLNWYGFTYEQFKEEIEQGTWNITENYYYSFSK